jgi:lysine 6-dehydrogenase
MRISVSGRKDSAKILHNYEMIDYFDERKNITAMGRTTAYTAFAVVKLVIEKKIKQIGVVPPEILGMDKKIFAEIKQILKERDFEIREKRERF